MVGGDEAVSGVRTDAVVRSLREKAKKYREQREKFGDEAVSQKGGNRIILLIQAIESNTIAETLDEVANTVEAAGKEGEEASPQF